MSWGNCGTDSMGRPIGYAVPAKCDRLGCNAEIDRGISYACGDMHGQQTGFECEGYYCPEHRRHVVKADDDSELTICDSCAGALAASPDYVLDEEECMWVRRE